MAISAGAPDAPATLRDVYTVSRLNSEVRLMLESGFPLLWVEGEISNLARPSSGHIYFSLKDASAQVRCAMFRQQNRHLGFEPDNGTQVLARARVGLYEPRGDYQLIVEHMEESGDGALRRAFEALKQRLDKEGLFDSARKRPLAALPQRIGIITSPTGAAIRDVLSVLRRRFPAIPVVVYPVPVQGTGAGDEIAAMIGLANRRAECDVLILTRGGGSLEDLWAFNEEVVARAVFASEIPVVSAVGHEIDFTISDFVADQRAATPSAAAELVSPDRQEWLQKLQIHERRLIALVSGRVRHDAQQLKWLTGRLQHPGQRLQRIAQRVDELEQRLLRAQQGLLRHARARLGEGLARLHRHTPIHRLRELKLHSRNLRQRLERATTLLLDNRGGRLAATVRALDTVSPLATLTRGYAIVTRLPDGEVVRTATQVSPGDRIAARLGEGSLKATVDTTEDPDPAGKP